MPAGVIPFWLWKFDILDLVSIFPFMNVNFRLHNSERFIHRISKNARHTSLQNVLKPTRDRNLWSPEIKLDYLTQLRQDSSDFICHMSDEIISSESEATVNNQNPSTPPSSACPLSSVKGTTHIDSHCHIIITNNTKHVRDGSHRTDN